MRLRAGCRTTKSRRLRSDSAKLSDGGLARGAPRSFSVILGSEEFVSEVEMKFMRESGVTQASQRISIGLKEDENLRKAVKVIEKRFHCEMCSDPDVLLPEEKR